MGSHTFSGNTKNTLLLIALISVIPNIDTLALVLYSQKIQKYMQKVSKICACKFLLRNVFVVHCLNDLVMQEK